MPDGSSPDIGSILKPQEKSCGFVNKRAYSPHELLGICAARRPVMKSSTDMLTKQYYGLASSFPGIALDLRLLSSA